MKCAICDEEMKDYESNNPYPLLTGENERVCRDCNDFVTASRIYFMGADKDSKKILCANIANVLKMGFSLKRSREEYMKRWRKNNE